MWTFKTVQLPTNAHVTYFIKRNIIGNNTTPVNITQIYYKYGAEFIGLKNKKSNNNK